MNFSKKWIWPGLLVLLIAPFTPWIDLQISHFFFSIGNDPVTHFVSHPALSFLFDYANVPATLTAASATLLLLLSYPFKRWKQWRNPCLVLLLTYAMGAGLIVNILLKEYWGRPRPKQIEQFGGTQAFRPFYSPHFFHEAQFYKSFPCGHCTMGFYFFALALVGRRLHKHLLWKLGMILAFTLGITFSLLRMAQGGHFFSDTLLSALIMWYTALAMDWLVYSGEELT